MPAGKDGQTARVRKLSSLMREALELSRRLEEFSAENLTDLGAKDDEAIFAAIKERERIIALLIRLEKEAGTLIGGAEKDAVSAESEQLRREIRSILRRVSDIDSKAMSDLSDKIQTYRDKALAARNKKQLSAYIKSGPGSPPARGRDYNNLC